MLIGGGEEKKDSVAADIEGFTDLRIGSCEKTFAGV